MKYKGNIILVVVILIIYLANQYFLKSTGFWFFTDYLNDLLAVPLFLSIINIVYLWESNKKIADIKTLIIITIGLSFLGEIVAIFTRPDSVIDIFDVFCYFIGMFLYYLIEIYS